MVSRPKNGKSARHAADVGADGVTLFSRNQAAEALGIAGSTLRAWQTSRRLVPALQREGIWLYTKEQLDRELRKPQGELAAKCFGLFEEGLSAVAVVMQLQVEPAIVEELHTAWVRMTASWVVRGPEGPRAAWEATYNLGPLTPEKLRRALELCAARSELRERLLEAS